MGVAVLMRIALNPLFSSKITKLCAKPRTATLYMDEAKIEFLSSVSVHG